MHYAAYTSRLRMPNQNKRIAAANHTCMERNAEKSRGVMVNTMTGLMSCHKCIMLFRSEKKVFEHIRSNKHNVKLGIATKEPIAVSETIYTHTYTRIYNNASHSISILSLSYLYPFYHTGYESIYS